MAHSAQVFCWAGATLVKKAYANHSPNTYLPRVAKVGKEEIVGMLAAVELDLRKGWDAERKAYRTRLDSVATHLKDVPSVVTEYPANDDFSYPPRLSIQWDEQMLGITLVEMMTGLEDGEPGIVATDMTKYKPHWKSLGIFANNLLADEELIVAERVKEILLRKS